MAINPKKCRLVGVIARNVRRFRLEREISQEALAEQAGVHRTYIGMIERREKNLTVYQIERLASALRIEPAELLVDGAANMTDRVRAPKIRR